MGMRKILFFSLLVFVSCTKHEFHNHIPVATDDTPNFTGKFKYSISMVNILGLPLSPDIYNGHPDNPGSFWTAIRKDQSGQNEIWISSLHGLDQ